MTRVTRKSNITINISTLIGNLIVVTNNESEVPEHSERDNPKVCHEIRQHVRLNTFKRLRLFSTKHEV